MKESLIQNDYVLTNNILLLLKLSLDVIENLLSMRNMIQYIHLSHII